MPIFTPTEITDNYMKASVGKAASPAWRLFVLAVAAGLLIGLGGVTSSTAAHALDNAGMVRLVSGLIFPVGLMMVILMGTELFTGNALMITAVLDGRITWGRLLRNWGIVFAGNLVGAVLLAACMANTAQDTAGRILGIFFPIMGFVLAGFEHCVADMYYVPAGIFAYMNPAYTGMIDAAGINTALLTFGDFIAANLIPVTLGNIVGGVLVGATMYACHRTKSAK